MMPLAVIMKNKAKEVLGKKDFCGLGYIYLKTYFP
jgi:hypothetical protein